MSISAVPKDSYPATAILVNANGEWENRASTPEQVRFFYNTVLRAITSYQEGRFSDFDAHTSSTSCHGVALLVRDTIQSLKDLDLQILSQEGKTKLKEIEERSFNPKNQASLWHVPSKIIELARLYILGYVREMDPLKGGRTIKKKLRDIAPISTALLDKLVDNLQRQYANVVALRYSQYVKNSKKEMEISGAPLSSWGKYVQPKYLRTDKRSVVYAPCMYSMQVALAHLSITKAKIAVVNDLRTETGEFKGRFIHLLQGDGEGKFNSVTELEKLNPSDPVVVFSGCAHSDTMDLDGLKEKMSPWMSRFTNLVLACDVYYPQFPKSADDPKFNSNPIIAEENELNQIIEEHRKVEGTSAQDSRLFCLNHNYPASVGQVLEAMKEEEPKTLPVSFIPQKLKQPSTDMSACQV